jgi:hypothetical protein
MLPKRPQGDRELVRPSAIRNASKSSPKPKPSKNRPKRRKMRWGEIFEDVFDIVEDIFD